MGWRNDIRLEIMAEAASRQGAGAAASLAMIAMIRYASSASMMIGTREYPDVIVEDGDV